MARILSIALAAGLLCGCAQTPTFKMEVREIQSPAAPGSADVLVLHLQKLKNFQLYRQYRWQKLGFH